jgi:hypothetical protein
MRRAIIRPCLAFLVLAGGLRSAGATAGFTCSGDDATLKFDLASAFERRIGGSFLNLAGQIELRLKAVPAEFRLMRITADELTQRWLDHNELKLELYWQREHQPFGFIELAVHTKSITEGIYFGGYALTVYDTDSDRTIEPRTSFARGNVTCFVE